LLIEKEAMLVLMETSVDELKLKHANLDNQLDEERQRPHPDQFVITQIKREKLKVKDAIAHLEVA
jgi:hypothetical protein